MMKRLLIFLLAAALACAFTGCACHTGSTRSDTDNSPLGDYLHNKDAMAKSISAIREKAGSDKVGSIVFSQQFLLFTCQDAQIKNQKNIFSYWPAFGGWKVTDDPSAEFDPRTFFDINYVNLMGIPDLVSEAEQTAAAKGIDKPVVNMVSVSAKHIGSADISKQEIYISISIGSASSGKSVVATAFADAQAKMTEFKLN